MVFNRQVVGLLVAAAVVAAADGTALAKGGKAGRVKERVAFEDTGTVSMLKARMRVDRRSLARQELRVQVEGAPTGLDLEVLMEDAAGSGVLVSVGSLAEEGSSGEYKWRLRTKKGDALPFGVADLAELSGRAVEIRATGGELVAEATFPSFDPTTVTGAGKRGNGKLVSQFAATDDAAAFASGDDAVHAKVKVRRKNGEEELEIEVEHLVSGLVVEAWVADGSGGFALVGTLVEKADDDGAEYGLEIETEHGDPLPLGVASLAELAGRTVEVRLADGTVLATGTLPALGEGPSGSGDDGGMGRGRGSDDGSDDSGDEEDDGSSDDDSGDDSPSDD